MKVTHVQRPGELRIDALEELARGQRERMTARRMGAAQFKERCLQVLDELPAEGVIITKRGKPVARLTPFERSGESLIGALKGKIQIRGDIMGTGVVWDASAADD